MYGVPTGQHCYGPNRVKQVLKADWAVLMHAVLDTDMGLLKTDGITAVASAATQQEIVSIEAQG